MIASRSRCFSNNLEQKCGACLAPRTLILLHMLQCVFSLLNQKLNIVAPRDKFAFNKHCVSAVFPVGPWSPKCRGCVHGFVSQFSPLVLFIHLVNYIGSPFNYVQSPLAPHHSHCSPPDVSQAPGSDALFQSSAFTLALLIATL